ncbi:type VI secretion system ATPase TssH [Burkholderia stagnalis]|uniref:type VI secretion system ATPase TssH n=1 Tax=Burkholderia stagnalis TaxID=1503054 RepID=UPI000757A385|nr:type VI secretion system ATPase TssH [Burkholderia stagnalis]KVO50007.1 ClpV1 family T6SS ATPase [Burkholderia stagnalis]KVP01608.1 ClpV1 family T6SS ATPase [Burkholderia stagnalis]KVW93644.1 ClpV1 family T6SS ATPase [Burkholderia stagnalis]KWH79475.1 ClpV1 family T6SS ATPase [Burkholderia stagnalis]KWK25191.1 ClpV1 family T6SS ATPase [Burkholderia stagnalis]
MSDIGRVTLFGKLNPFLYETLEQATGFCRLRGNPYVELAHWLKQILQRPDSDLHRILRRFEIDAAALERGLVAALDRLPRGAGSVSDLSVHIDDAVERAWVYATLKYDATRIRGATLVLAILKTPQLRSVLVGIAREFERIVPDVLADTLDAIVDGSPEAPLPDAPGVAGVAPASAAAAAGDGSALARFAVDLTARARAGEIDPVIGRDAEIRQVVDILLRRRQNNPLLVGEAGVGKTAVAEGFALRIVAGDVPPPLRDVALYLLDLGLLQAGAGVKGEFESRLRGVIDEAMSGGRPAILFIDEVHTLVGAGGAAGTGDAANLLKPALARGLLRTIGATTWSEYKQYIEKDPALTRRFQLVHVHEPEEEAALAMLRGLAAKLEAHHRVLVLDDALQAAVTLSHRYIPARQLPDKAISLLDTVCARVAVSQHAVPAPIEDARRRIDRLQVEHERIGRECALGTGDAARRDAIATAIAGAQAELDRLDARWQAERDALATIVAARAALLDDAPSRALDADARAAAQGRLAAARQALADLQGDAPLVLPAVDTHAVAAVVADWTGIPLGRMVRDETQAVLNLAATLGERVVGQRHAVELIAERIQTARARLDDPAKPHGVFLLCGPSGVGKTETALALADTLYGGEHNAITINMSEFQEAHTVSTLKGAPPGYVGYGQGGVLTEAVRRRPYSVVLLDEIEKAHRDVHELFFQVFDKGWMEDGEGRAIDFRHTVILLTSNVGSEQVIRLCRDPERLPGTHALADALRVPLRDVFPAALLGRLTVVPYYPLTDATLARVVALQVARIARRIDAHHGIRLHCADSATALIVERCRTIESGGRMVDAILTHAMLPRISRAILEATLEGRALASIDVSAADGEFVYRFDEEATT